MGPLTPRLKAELERSGRGLDTGVSWSRLSEYLRHVERRGASQNVASFIGAGTLRAGAVGYGDRPATPAELDRMRQVAAARGTDPLETALDLIASDRSRIQTAYFSMSEENLRAALRRPWVAIISDSASMAPESWSLRVPVHPRAYGSFARVLGRYARDEKVLPLADAIRRMSGLPATLGLSGRGVLREGGYADIVVFDPATVTDRATFANPHQLSAGVSEVLVNGKVAVSGGAFTGELAGRPLAGPGARR